MKIRSPGPVLSQSRESTLEDSWHMCWESKVLIGCQGWQTFWMASGDLLLIPLGTLFEILCNPNEICDLWRWSCMEGSSGTLHH